MSIGEDIKSVLADLGVSFKLVRDSGVIDGGRLDYAINESNANPFIREHCLSVTFAFDTPAVVGDIVHFDTDGRYFLVAHKTPEVFENAVITHEGTLYMCNATVSFLRPSGEVQDQSYRTITHWEPLRTYAPALLTNRNAMSSMDTSRDFMQMDIAEVVAYVPKSWNVLQHDRMIVSGEIVKYDEDHFGERRYSVKHKDSFNFGGMEIVYLEEDTRE